jgi:hypothetical protein
LALAISTGMRQGSCSRCVDISIILRVYAHMLPPHAAAGGRGDGRDLWRCHRWRAGSTRWGAAHWGPILGGQIDEEQQSGSRHSGLEPLQFRVPWGRWDRNRTCNLRFWRPNRAVRGRSWKVAEPGISWSDGPPGVALGQHRAPALGAEVGAAAPRRPPQSGQVLRPASTAKPTPGPRGRHRVHLPRARGRHTDKSTTPRRHSYSGCGISMYKSLSVRWHECPDCGTRVCIGTITRR